MREVFFNSRTPQMISDGEVENIVRNYANVIKCAGNLGYKKVRYETGLDDVMLTQNESLKSYCGKHSRDNSCQLLLSTVRRPYIDETDEQKVEQYILNQYRLKMDGQEYDDMCFCAAYLANSFLVGLDVIPIWKNLKYSLSINSDNEELEEPLYCVVSEEQYQDREFSKWIDEHDIIDGASIIKTSVEPSKKKIHLRDDHGKDLLTAHAHRILNSPFVIEIINSTPFKQYAKQYVDEVKANGQIEIVLMNTDAKFGMVVQTTGRNLKETIWIANELKKKYAE